jgi:quercetin dioxygenase-like cupin family protein
MASQLGMAFTVKLSWEDLYTNPFSTITETDVIRKNIGLAVTSREEFKNHFNKEYFRENQCAKMWVSPQINYDGRVLGCPVNFWDHYGNAFQDGLENSLNNEKINYARLMLLGRRESRMDIPCTRCKIYQRMKKAGTWMQEGEIRGWHLKSRLLVSIENRMLEHWATSRLLDLWSDIKQMSKGNDDYQQGAPTHITGLISEFRRRKMPRLRSRVQILSLPLAPDKEKGWKPYPQFKGVTRRIRHLSCHVSVLKRDHCPHPPHRHKEEEILMLLCGEVEITLPDYPSSDGTHTRRLKPGDFVYYPAFFGHTLTCVSEQPANYLMFKWHDKERRCIDELPFSHSSVRAFLQDDRIEKGFTTRKIFEGATGCLQRLQCHTSTLTPKTGYPAHSDPYDVAILVLDGEVKTLNSSVTPHGLIFYAGGEPHGMYNPGMVTAKYIVFEFQGRPNHIVDLLFVKMTAVFRKAKDPQRWKAIMDKIK